MVVLTVHTYVSEVPLKDFVFLGGSEFLQLSSLSLVTESPLIVLDFGNSALHEVTFKFTMHH